jgi:polyhydroxybutyrate depolymerase
LSNANFAHHAQLVRKRWLPGALVLLGLAACSPGAGSATAHDPQRLPLAASPAAGRDVTIKLGGRPFQLYVPGSYRPGEQVPLVVLLHGFRASATMQETYFRMTGESERRGFLYAMPDGTADRDGLRFWNATPACCDRYHTGVDDSDYLSRLLTEVASSYSVDPHRVYLVGHSNGGFMAYRMACDHAGVITAIVSLAGAMTDDPARCRPDRPVSVLQIHGTADATIRFDGQTEGRSYPSVATTLADWRRLDGCSDTADTSAPPMDLVSNLPGAETTVTTYHDGCRDGTRVELWSIQDGAHVPALTMTFARAVVDFLYAQTSP